jgi:FKBP-type peptidyl-prolyl cis-trans isomerase FkpA
MRIMKTYSYQILISIFIILSATSCVKNYTKKFEDEEKAKIQEYLKNNSSLNFELKPSGLYYLNVVIGTGLQPVAQDTAYVLYTTKLLDGTQIDTNVGTKDTLIFPVNTGFIIAGLDEGITYMKQGGKAILLIPSSLAYGSTGDFTGKVLGYTPLLYYVELKKVKKGSSGK